MGRGKATRTGISSPRPSFAWSLDILLGGRTASPKPPERVFWLCVLWMLWVAGGIDLGDRKST